MEKNINRTETNSRRQHYHKIGYKHFNPKSGLQYFAKLSHTLHIKNILGRLVSNQTSKKQKYFSRPEQLKIKMFVEDHNNGILTIILLNLEIEKRMDQKTVFNHDEEFNQQQLIWGKVTGHPWWPGIITVIPDLSKKKLYRVDFFGDPPSHSILPSNKIIKYEQYTKALNQGRPCPELKRAIYEASIFQNTIQQSKNTQDPRDLSGLVGGEQNNFGLSPLFKLGQREPATHHKFYSRPISLLKSPRSEETFVYNYGGKKSKKINKYKDGIKKLKFSQEQKNPKNSRKQRQARIQEILKRYRLDSIPKPEIQEREPEYVDKEKLTMRKLKKLLRIRFHSEEVLEKTLKFKGKISSCFDLKEIIQKVKKGEELNDY